MTAQEQPPVRSYKALARLLAEDHRHTTRMDAALCHECKRRIALVAFWLGDTALLDALLDLDYRHAAQSINQAGFWPERT